MAKQLNVNLAFSADTAQAKAQIKDLQGMLSQLTTTKMASSKIFDSASLKDGIKAAKELKNHLNAATDANTGKLNLSAFSASLKASNQSLSTYKKRLESLGPEGEAAFLKISKSIATADAPLRRTSSHLKEFATTMKNTARWQISSSILHGFMGAIQSAHGYAKDLNKSLNDIRIVTGKNSEQMADFAINANKAAKALSTTTTAYTKAALIYYQQGDSSDTVLKKTDVTTKMANVTGQSAEIVSDQLTAIWNNFNKSGEESYEKYADILTALGAATASSTDEIAGGLEKFASVADMIGLSYEYAASALATITATTRQSEDVVGTALKTIFARIQGLTLGDTLEDGTDLNKYSQALMKVGISIKDQNGQLKDMDTILNEMGAKWKTLAKDQQVALAQTVAGVRQYNQLVSLMDNWNFFESNLDIAKNSEGTLQEQADIYAESWEASSKRVKAALETIYSTIINDKFFIDLNNAFAVILDGVKGLMEGMGGMEGILSTISAFITQKLAKEAPIALTRIKENLLQITGQAKTIADSMQIKNLTFLKNEAKTSMTTFQEGQGSLEYAASSQMTAYIAEQKMKLIKYEEQYNSAEKAAAEQEINNLEVINSMLTEKGQRYDQLNKETLELEQTLSNSGRDFLDADDSYGVDHLLMNIRDLAQESGALKNIVNQFDNIKRAAKEPTISVQDFRLQLKELATATAKSTSGKQQTFWFALAKDLVKVKNEAGLTKEKLLELFQSSDAFKGANHALIESEQSLTKIVREMSKIEGINPNILNSFVNKLKEMGLISSEVPSQLGNVGASFDNLRPHVASTSEALMSFSSALMQINALISSVTHFGDIITDEDATIAQKFGATIGLLTTGLMTFNAVSQLTTTLMALQTTGEKASTISKVLNAIATKNQNAAELSGIPAKIAATAANWGLNASMAPLLVVTLALTAAVAILAGGIWLLTKAFQSWKESTPEGQLAALKEQANQSEEAFNRVTESVNNTKNAIENLQNSYNTIETLTKGTYEWYEAVTKINSEVLKLIEKFPELSSMVFSDEGILKFSEEGFKYIDQINQKYLMASNGKKVSDQIAVKQQELNTSYSNSKMGPGVYGSELEKMVQSYYNDPKVGDTLFSREGSEQLAKGIMENGGYTYFGKNSSDEVLTEKDLDDFYNRILDSKDRIQNRGLLENNISLLEEGLLENQAANFNSNRTGSEVRDLIGMDYSDIVQKEQKNISNAFGNWNDHINYSESDAEWDNIEKFMKLQGDNVNYVAQRNGKMVLEIDGQEKSFDSEDVYSSLANLSAGDVFESSFKEGLQSNLKSSLSGDFSFDNLQLEDLTALDNLKSEITKNVFSFNGEEDSQELSDSIFNTIASSFGNKEGLEELSNITSSINFGDPQVLREFKASLNALTEDDSTENVAAFTETLAELNAQGQILNMSSTFSNAAKEMGLKPEAAKEMQDYAQNILEVAKDSDILDDSLTQNADGAADLAIEVTKMNSGVEELSKGFKDWNSILRKSDKSSAEYAQALSGMKQSLSKVLDVESDLIDSDFVTEHLGEIEKASQGDAEAIDSLRSLMDEEIIQRVTVGQSEDFIENINTLQQNLTTEMDRINEEIPDIQVGAVLNDDELLTAANELVKTSQMTADEANAYFAGIGYEPVYSTEDIDNSAQAPNAQTTMKVTETGWDTASVDMGLLGTHDVSLPTITYTTESKPLDPVDAPAETTLTSFSGDGKPPEIKGLRKKATGNMNNHSSTNSGGPPIGGKGSKSKPKKAKNVKKSDVVERYKEINDNIDNLTDSLNDANKASDRLYGKNKIKEMEKVNSLIKDEISLIEQKKDEAEGYLKNDQQALQLAASEAGVNFNIDEKTHDILNYTSEMEKLYNELDSAIKNANADGNADETEQEKIDKIQEKIDKLKEALSVYEETKELVEDLDNDIQDKFNQWQDNNFEMLNYKLELKVQVNDNELKELDYKFNKIADDFYKSAEAFGILFGEDGEVSKLSNVKQALTNQEEASKSLEAAYKAGEISQADYIDGLQSCHDEIYNNLEALQDLDEEMINYYGETLSKANEEIAKYTDQMDHLTGVLDHYKNIMGLLGREKDYKSMGVLLEGSAKTQKNNYEASKSKYDMLKEQEALVKADYLKDPENKVFKKKMEDITVALREAEDEMLSDAEAYGEAIKEVLSNKMEEAAHNMEMALTDGIGFDALSDSLSRLSSYQDEYLTKTNQVYETNKMLRQIAQDIDKTDNKAAKNKYSNFAKEIEQLQEKGKLSNTELQIAQAKYKMIQAEMALEEAKNAKSVVRLSQDNEGNYGYVYTADQDKVSDAEQELADAENDLYNIRLDATNSYGEKKIQAERDFAQKLAEVDQKAAEDSVYREGAYQAERAAIVKEYTDLITAYSEIYGIATEEDSRVVKDAWVNTYDKIILDEENWKEATETYSTNVKESLQSWETETDELTRLVGEDFDEVKEKTDAVTTASDQLKDKLIDDVMPSIDNQLTKVGELTSAYGYQQGEIQTLIEKYEALTSSIKDTIAAEAQLAGTKNSSSPSHKETQEDTDKSIKENVSDTDKTDKLASEAQELVQRVHTGKVGNGGAWVQDAKNKGYSQESIDIAKRAFNDSKAGGGYSYYYDEALKLAGSYDTGGYTGKWGTEGKLALLHQKEIVLNAVDTENLLSSIQILREITKAIDLNALFQNNNLNGNSLIPVQTPKESLEQEVTIHAEFPNVSDKYEIEEAFNTLVNRASQFVNRR